MKLKTMLYLVHRWLGITVCLLVSMWFATGMVMMYVAYPELTKQEQYAGLSVLDPESIAYSPASLLAKAPSGTSVEHLMLTSIARRPVYLLKRQDSPWFGLYADTGDLLSHITSQAAVTSAVGFYTSRYPDRAVTGVALKTLEMDQWTVSSRLSDYRPMHLVELSDRAGTHLYVSARTGQVVQDTTRGERIWNWLGANLHWIYPLQLRKHTNIWVNTIIVLSLTGLITIFSGAIIGLLRLRVRRPYRGKSCSPYRGVPKYHHVFGLLSLSFLTSFMFSGLMSMAPWGVFDAETNFAEQVHRYRLGDDSDGAELAYSQVGEIQKLLKSKVGLESKQLVWHWIGGESYITLHSSDRPPQYHLAKGGKRTLERIIQTGLGRIIPDEHILTQQRLDEYDAYYYSHHGRIRPLPIKRIKFSDHESTWFHVDLSTGEVFERLTARNRVERWLFNGLHSLDFAVLINHRPTWDLVLITLCSVGFLFSLTSVVMAWQRLGRRAK